MTTLFELLTQMPDHRRSEGKRFSLPSFVEMIVVAGMSGRFSIRNISRFIKDNEAFFVDRYALRHGVPSQTAIYNFLNALNFGALNKILIKWMRQHIDNQDTKWISIDGKAISSTVTDQHGSKQNYKVIVTAFASKQGVAIDSMHYSNKEGLEQSQARQMIESLENQGILFTLDATHCQKKQRKPLWWEEMTI